MFKNIKYFIEYLLILLFYSFFKILGLRLSSITGGLFLWVFGKLTNKNIIAMKNLNKVFPQKSYKEKKDIINKMWFHFGRIVGEYPHLEKFDLKKINYIKVINHKNCINPCKIYNNCLFFSAHIGNWELTSHPITQYGNKMWFIYRAPNNHYIDKLLANIRRKYGVGLIKKGPEGAKKCIKLLKKKKENIGMLIDQKMNDGIETQFFGHKAMTASAIAKFAIKYKCPIIPTLCEREKGINFKITYFPPITHKTIVKLKTEKNIMNHLNKQVESWILQNPEQWMWAHNRWLKD